MRKEKKISESSQPLTTESETPTSDTPAPVQESIQPPAAPTQEQVPQAQRPAQPTAAPKSKAQQKAEQKAGDPLRGSRASGFYASVVALGVLLVLLIIFIFQNTQKTTVNYIGWSGNVSVAVALLIAAAAGLFVAVLASSLRILQLRRRIKRDRKAA